MLPAKPKPNTTATGMMIAIWGVETNQNTVKVCTSEEIMPMVIKV